MESVFPRPAAMRVEWQAWCADNLALLAALEGRAEAAVQLVGAADARHEADGDTRQGNEAATRASARKLAAGALGAGPAAELHAAGRMLDDAAVAALAFAERTPGSRRARGGIRERR